MKEISITDIENIRIGQAEDAAAGTGLTVILCPNGAAAGLDIRGGGPAGRETGLLDPLAAAQEIHAVVLSGGSAFGLDAAGGVMKYLEAHGIGFDVGVTKVPLVCQSCLFDLTVGDTFTRPDAAMALRACEASEHGNYRDGNYGAGTGATVGKLGGMEHCMKSGIGSYAIQLGKLKVGALAAVNALGDIFDPDTGRRIAGMRGAGGHSLASTSELLYSRTEPADNCFTGNTTLCAVITNGRFDKTQLCKIAGMAHDGMARAIRPVHTGADGDSIYALSVGTVNADRDTVGALAADVVARAIVRAGQNAEGAYGFPAAKDLPAKG